MENIPREICSNHSKIQTVHCYRLPTIDRKVDRNRGSYDSSRHYWHLRDLLFHSTVK